MVIENFQVSASIIYARLFDESKEGPFEVPPFRTKVFLIRKPVPDSPKLYVLKDRKSACVFYSKF